MEMKTSMKTGLLAATLALALGGIATAQDGAPPPPPMSGGGGPVVFGKVKSVDTSAHTIKLTGVRQGHWRTVHVEDDATICAEVKVSASELKVGDEISVHGVPTGITASSIIDGDVRDAMPPPPGMGGPGGADEDGPDGGGRQGRRPGPPTMASASGKITSLNPLTIEIGKDVSVVIKAGASAKVRKIVTEQISDIKVGDRIMASGDPGDDGVLDADHVAVNVHMPPPPPGMGGPGGPGMGGPGMGGPGMGGPGFGGPMMGGPGRRGRGGFGGPRMGGGGPGFGGQQGGGPEGFDDQGGGGGPRFGQRGPNDGGPGGFGGPDDQGGPPPPDMGGDQPNV